MFKDFNPLAKVFDKHKEREHIAGADLHNTDLYDEEGTAHGGEAVDPATGRPNVNRDEEPSEVQLDKREVNSADDDIMGDLKDPNKMSLEELIATQEEEV